MLTARARPANHLLWPLPWRQNTRRSRRESGSVGLELQPISSIAMARLLSTQPLYSGMIPRQVGTSKATCLLMQLFGPQTTQTAIRAFGEAARFHPATTSGLPATSQGEAS